jgi:hypothetical protein
LATNSPARDQILDVRGTAIVNETPAAYRVAAPRQNSPAAEIQTQAIARQSPNEKTPTGARLSVIFSESRSQ